MKDRPILFSGPMVRALLDGSKTQTRRVVKARADKNMGPRCVLQPHELAGEVNRGDYQNCPYGQPGDRFWVREAFDFLPSGGPDEPQACEIVYWATGSSEPRTAPSGYNPMIYGHEKIRPSIHMPRWASRITLEITGVRMERLQNISDADAIAEGVKVHPDHHGKPRTSIYSPVQAYRDLWESINGPGSWDANPWVWAVEFKRLKGCAT